MNDGKSIDLGGRLRQLRGARGVSIRSLAKLSGISANALSMIEQGKSSPSVSTLYKLADALQVPVTTFFGVEKQREKVIFFRSHEGPQVPIVRGFWEGRGGEKFEGRVEPFVLILEAGADSGLAPMVHTGHEFVYCLSGIIEYTVEERAHLLHPSDSLLFAAHLSHHWRNAGKTAATLLIVLSGFEETDRPLSVHLKESTKSKIPGR